MKLCKHDLAGVGIGPFNLSLAALLEPLRANGENVRPVFFESKPQFDWHSGMILPGTTLQVPFLADLVSMADPTSRFSFLNYLHEMRRLYRFYFYENFKIPRKEYNQYCRWVAEQLDSLQFGARVIDVRPLNDGGFELYYRPAGGGATQSVTSANVVLGYGTVPNVPECARPFLGDGVYHTAQFRNNRERFANAGRIAVFGSGQSAGECVLSLLQDQAERRYSLDWFTRGPGFLPMEYSKLGLEHFSPEYIDYFHGLPAAARDRIRAGQNLYYKGMSDDTIAAIYDTLYELQLEADAVPVTLAGNTELLDIQRDGRGFALHLRHRELDRRFVRNVDAVLLGTGYAYRLPEFLDNLLPILERDEQGRLAIDRDYRARRNDGRPGDVFVQNGEIHSHGIGAPDLGLGAYRSASIVNTLLGRAAYRLDRKNVFQTFGVPDVDVDVVATSDDLAGVLGGA